MDPYPLLCTPLCKPKLWGGTRLAELFGKAPVAGESNIGETWEVADLPEGASAIANGPLAGLTLTAAVCRHRGMILGEGAQWERFPLLVKFIDANDDLSVQVHPGAAACAKHFPGGHSKDESWIVVDAEPGGRILAGTRPGGTREDFVRALEAGRVEECLQSIAARPGEVFRMAPGTVHALGRGVVILEIQEPSDTTFRLWDYNRLDDKGNPRELHVEQALLSMRFEATRAVEPQVETTEWGRRERLVRAPVYEIERLHIERGFTWETATDRPQVLVVLDGALTVEGGGESLQLGPGEAVIVPAALREVVCEPEGETTVATSRPTLDPGTG